MRSIDARYVDPLDHIWLSAAAKLAAAGLDTTVIDEKLAWEKPCGGGITYKAYSRYPFLLENDTPKRAITETTLSEPRGGSVTMRLSKPLLIYSRYDLNNMLLRRAEDVGGFRHKMDAAKNNSRLCDPSCCTRQLQAVPVVIRDILDLTIDIIVRQDDGILFLFEPFDLVHALHQDLAKRAALALAHVDQAGQRLFQCFLQAFGQCHALDHAIVEQCFGLAVRRAFQRRHDAGKT